MFNGGRSRERVREKRIREEARAALTYPSVFTFYERQSKGVFLPRMLSRLSFLTRALFSGSRCSRRVNRVNAPTTTHTSARAQIVCTRTLFLISTAAKVLQPRSKVHRDARTRYHSPSGDKMASFKFFIAPRNRAPACFLARDEEIYAYVYPHAVEVIPAIISLTLKPDWPVSNLRSRS